MWRVLSRFLLLICYLVIMACPTRGLCHLALNGISHPTGYFPHLYEPVRKCNAEVSNPTIETKSICNLPVSFPQHPLVVPKTFFLPVFFSTVPSLITVDYQEFKG